MSWENVPKEEIDEGMWVSARTAAFYVGVDPSLVTILKNQGVISPPTGTTPNKGKYWLPTIMQEHYAHAQGLVETHPDGSQAERTLELLDCDGSLAKLQQRVL